MLNRLAKKVVLELYDEDGIVADWCYVNVTAPGISVKPRKTDAGKFYRWQWIKFASLDFDTEGIN